MRAVPTKMGEHRHRLVPLWQGKSYSSITEYGIQEATKMLEARSRSAKCWVYIARVQENRTCEVAFQWSGNGNPVVDVKAATVGT
jgi:hypothetical protein